MKYSRITRVNRAFTTTLSDVDRHSNGGVLPVQITYIDRMGNPAIAVGQFDGFEGKAIGADPIAGLRCSFVILIECGLDEPLRIDGNQVTAVKPVNLTCRWESPDNKEE